MPDFDSFKKKIKNNVDHNTNPSASPLSFCYSRILCGEANVRRHRIGFLPITAVVPANV